MAFTSYEAMPLDQMLNRVQKYHPGDGYKLVEHAWAFAEKAHEGQIRKSGELRGSAAWLMDSCSEERSRLPMKTPRINSPIRSTAPTRAESAAAMNMVSRIGRCRFACMIAEQ